MERWNRREWWNCEGLERIGERKEKLFPEKTWSCSVCWSVGGVVERWNDGFVVRWNRCTQKEYKVRQRRKERTERQRDR